MQNNYSQIFFVWLISLIAILFLQELFQENNQQGYPQAEEQAVDEYFFIPKAVESTEQLREINSLEQDNLIVVENDIFKVVFNKLGGDIYDFVLKKYLNHFQRKELI